MEQIITQIGPSAFAWIVVGVLLGYVGHGIQVGIVGDNREGWRGLWHRTAWAHPILVGALLGLSSELPVPVEMGAGIVPRVIWYALAGALSTYLYRHLQRRLRADERKDCP